MSEFFAMGGYALYVWGAYGLTAAVLAANVLWPLARNRDIRRQIRSQTEEVE